MAQAMIPNTGAHWKHGIDSSIPGLQTLHQRILPQQREILSYQKECIWLLLLFILANHWTTRVLDYTNVFPQANIDTDIYITEPPVLFGCKSGEDKVLKLRKSLHGLKQSPRTSYQHLSQGL